MLARVLGDDVGSVGVVVTVDIAARRLGWGQSRGQVSGVVRRVVVVDVVFDASNLTSIG